MSTMDTRDYTRLIDAPWVRFGLVGVLNTVVGYALMLGLYNLAGCGYWAASSVACVMGMILSFILNKRFTFRNADSAAPQVGRFFVNVAVAWFLAYGVAQKVVEAALSGMSEGWRGNIALAVGSVLFVVFNYLGQSRWVFRDARDA